MPGTDGHELVRVLRASAETDFLSIILLTAQAEDEQRLRGARARRRRVHREAVRDARARRARAQPDRVAAPAARAVLARAGGRRAPQRRRADVAPADQAYVARVREAIQRGLADPDFGVGELADAVSQDRSHLFRRVKQLFGESPSDLIRRMRVEEGERLLLADGSATVTDVAYAVGFNSLSYFCRCFQDVYGVTPAAYRSRAVRAATRLIEAQATLRRTSRSVARNAGRLKSQRDCSVPAEPSR